MVRAGHARPVGPLRQRTLFNGRFAETSVLYGVLAAVAIAVLGVTAGIRGMRNASV
ncbi:hypothetical protein ACWEKM_33435 [Streptomyces sp. NPDC004752]